MDATDILIESGYIFGQHSDGRRLTPDAVRMFGRIFDLTVRPALAVSSRRWRHREIGRRYALNVTKRIAEAAVELAGKKGALTGQILKRAANEVIDQERDRFDIAVPLRAAAGGSKFCDAYPWTNRRIRR